MQNIIKINKSVIGAESVNSVNARELWTALESKQEFANWIKNRLVRFVENVDYVSFDKSIKRENGATVRKEYIISTDVAKMISMLENNTKGDEVRRYFVEAEKQANKPQTYEEVMENAILLAHQKVEELKAKIEKDKPHTQFGKAISESSTSVKVGDLYMEVLCA